MVETLVNPSVKFQKGHAWAKFLAAAAATVVAAGCSRSTPPSLAEAIFEQEFAHLPAEFVPCLSVDGKDADAKLLDNIRKLRPDAVPGSECTFDIGGSYHNASRRKAMLMDVTRLSTTQFEYLARHERKWADYIRLEVHEGGKGWKVIMREAA